MDEKNSIALESRAKGVGGGRQGLRRASGAYNPTRASAAGHDEAFTCTRTSETASSGEQSSRFVAGVNTEEDGGRGSEDEILPTRPGSQSVGGHHEDDGKLGIKVIDPERSGESSVESSNATVKGGMGPSLIRLSSGGDICRLAAYIEGLGTLPELLRC